MSVFASSRCLHQRALSTFIRTRQCPRSIHWSSSCLNVAQKYLDKVKKRAEEQCVSVEQLKENLKRSNAKPTPLPESQKLHARKVEQKIEGDHDKVWKQNERRDNSPVKPLADIMDVHKLLRKPHTAAQISALWTAFHASRSSGTGRGFLSASIPLSTYENLVRRAKKYSTFIVPLMREAQRTEALDSGDTQSSYEFFFMQWAFHSAPSIPLPSLLDEPLPSPPPAPEHPLATVLFTPLLEYKTRTTFATPHLVLTLYPDLARSHDLVLLRGDLTPSPSGEGRYLLRQQDAQLLALGMQRFYLADDTTTQSGERERAELLRVFNEKPSDFRWEELLKHADLTS